MNADAVSRSLALREPSELDAAYVKSIITDDHGHGLSDAQLAELTVESGVTPGRGMCWWWWWWGGGGGDV